MSGKASKRCACASALVFEFFPRLRECQASLPKLLQQFHLLRGAAQCGLLSALFSHSGTSLSELSYVRSTSIIIRCSPWQRARAALHLIAQTLPWNFTPESKECYVRPPWLFP